MNDRDFRVHGEFYTAPVYNYLIAEGARVGIYEIAPEGKGMFGMGTPEGPEAFLGTPHPWWRRVENRPEAVGSAQQILQGRPGAAHVAVVIA
ncbi:MAG: hypothetical protein ACOX9B_12875 [Candidatus Xenobium sp.]|jgi:hypothetical protein|nr:hypothetical protein [Burkholderiales bacterium]